MIDLEQVRIAYNLTPPLALYPLPGGTNNAVMGLQTGQGEFVIKTLHVRHDPATLQHEFALTTWLAAQGLSFSVPVPLVTRAGHKWLITATDQATPKTVQLLLPRIPGKPIDWRAPAQITMAGAALAELHQRLARYPAATATAYVPYGALAQIHPLVADPAHLSPADLGLPTTPEYERVLAWWRAEVAALQTFIEGPYQTLPRQLIHGDVGLGNFLYAPDPERGRITAILDFEFAGPDVRSLDLAAGLYFCMRIGENNNPLVNAAAFCRGYGQRQEVTAAELAALPWLIRLRNVVSTVWWFGRSLAAGTQLTDLRRIEQLQAMVTWLTRNTISFQATLQKAFLPQSLPLSKIS